MFWKIYAWIYLILVILGYFSMFMGLVSVNMPLKIFESSISLFGAVPLFLYAYNKLWLRKLFWKIFFFIFILIEIKDIPLFIQTNPSLVPNAIMGAILSMPCYIAIFLFAFQRKEK